MSESVRAKCAFPGFGTELEPAAAVAARRRSPREVTGSRTQVTERRARMRDAREVVVLRLVVGMEGSSGGWVGRL